MKLAQISHLALLLGVDEDDQLADLALERASARFVSAVGWPVDWHNTKATPVPLYGDGGRHLRIPAMNAREVEVSMGGKPVEDFTLDARLSLLTRPGGWPCRERVDVGYVAGWALHEMPADIQDAVLDQAAALYQAMQNRGASRITRGPFTMEWRAGAGGSGQVGVTAAWDATVAAYAAGLREWS